MGTRETESRTPRLFAGSWTINGGTLRKERIAGTLSYEWTFTAADGAITIASSKAAALKRAA